MGIQFGFIKGIAREDAIFKITNYILNGLNNKTMVGSNFCDLEKAFDSVKHEILLSELPYYRISSKAKLLLDSYIQNRNQSVQITNSYFDSNAVSKCNKINHGVPQNSILGSLLFLIHNKDLPKAAEHKAFPI